MNWKSLSCVLAAAVLLAGCDLGSPKTEATGDGGGTPIDPTLEINSPVLIAIESVQGGTGDPRTLCPGMTVVLSGFNFSDQLGDHRVEFSAGNQTALGLPIDVEVERSDGPDNSLLEVVVPAGISQGTIQLFVGGVSAGAVGYDSCPYLYAVTVGPLEDLDALNYTPLVGFDQGSGLTLYGLNLADVQAVVLSDGRGSQQEVSADTFVHNSAFGGVTGQVPTGYDSFSFPLNNGDPDIRFPYTNPPDRHNLQIEVRGPNGTSNLLEVPVLTNPAANRFGVGINAVRVPTGVATGPVAIYYQIYERLADASWLINVEWRVPGVTDTPPVSNQIPNASGWVAAFPAENDPRHDGTEEIVAGPIALDDGRRLLPGGGLLRAFVWDAQCDPLFRQLVETPVDGVTLGPDWRVEFRIRPEPDAGERTFIDHTVETPPIIYLDLEDKQGSDLSALRQTEIYDGFDTTTNVDVDLTTALWGPPRNRSLLAGLTEAPAQPQFGTGQANVILEPILGARTVSEWTELLGAAGLVCGPILDVPAALSHPQALARDMVVEREHPAYGPVKLLGSPWQLSGTPVAPTTPPPVLGEHTEAVLQDLLGLDDARLAELRELGVIEQAQAAPARRQEP